MAEARASDDRLPWLDAPRRAPRPTPAERHVRAALLVVLGMFMASMIAVMAYLVGRSTAPVAPRVARPPSVALAPPVAQAPVLPPSAPPALAPPIAAPLRVPPAVARVSAANARATAAPVMQRTTASQTTRQAAPARATAREARVSIRRTVRPRVAPLRYQWPAPSLAGPSGRVVQLGAYRTTRQTNAAWRRLVRAFPHLATYPRRVTRGAPSAGRTRYYRLRIGTTSPADARALCNRLNAIGRGCTIV